MHNSSMSASYPAQGNGNEVSWEKYKELTLALVSVAPCNNQQVIWAVRTLKFLYILQAVIEVSYWTELNCTW